jgi:hypothetical protein
VHTRAPLSAARKTYAQRKKNPNHNRHKQEQQQKICIVASFGAAANSGASQKLGAL